MENLQNTNIFFEPLYVTFALGLTTIILLYWFSTRNHGYWKKRGVPYLKPSPFFGSVFENWGKPVNEMDLEKYRKYGHIYGYFEGNQPMLSVSDPALLRDIFVKDFPIFPVRRTFSFGDDSVDTMLTNLQGEDWKRVRTIISPTFSTGKIKRMLSIFNECSENLVKNMRSAKEKGETIEVKSFFGAFTMDVIASSAFSTKIDSLNDPNNEFIINAKKCFPNKLNWAMLMLLLVPGFLKLLRFTIKSKKHPFTFFKGVINEIIEKRKTTGQTRNDFLQILLDVTKELTDKGELEGIGNENDDIAENYGKDESEKMLKNWSIKKTLSFNELIAQCLIFLLAGYETTASAVSLVTYSLALNPDIQEKLINELDEVLKANDGEVTYEAIQSMKYLDNVISEALRMYPPAIRTERRAAADYKLGNTGIIIPKGMLVSIPIYLMHRDPNNYPDPEKFDPDRFTPEERAKRDQYVYIPFGAGPRNCVAMRFALMEIKVCLAHLLRNFRVKRCPQTMVPLQIYTGQAILRPKEIMLELEERNIDSKER